MANWSNPTLASLYTDFLSELKARDEDLAKQFDGQTLSNLVTGTIRWSSTANRWQKWSGTAWVELASTYALTGLSTTGNAAIGGTLAVTGSTTLAAATATTPATADNSTAIATTAYVRAQGYAGLAGPAFTGAPSAPTAAADTNTTQLATTAFVLGQAGSGTPAMNGTAAAGTSLRYARQDHVHPSDTTRAGLASPAFTGTPTGPTAAADTNTTQLATTAFVLGQAGSTAPVMNGTAAVGTSLRYARQDHVHPTDTTRAPLASPGLTGTPTAPTAAAGTNTTQLATTAFVQAEIAADALLLTGGTLTGDLTVPALTVTGTTIPQNGIFRGSATNALAFAVNSTERARIDASSRVLLGSDTYRSVGTPNLPTGLFFTEGAGLGHFNVFVGVHNRDANTGPSIVLGKTRGTAVGSNTVVQVDDELGALTFAGADGTTLQSVGARIQAFVDGAPATNSIPARLSFSTTTNGGAAPVERMRIAADGSITSVVPGGTVRYPAFSCRAWVNFNGTGTVAIRDEGNVSSITDNGTGAYTVNFTAAMPNANYAVIATSGDGGAANYCIVQVSNVTAPTTGAVRLQTLTQNSGNPAATDHSRVSVAIFA